MIMKTLIQGFAAASLLWAGMGAALAEQAASVALATGKVSVTRDGQALRLRTGDAVHAGDQIETAHNSYANLLFADGGRILLRPNTQFVVEDFQQGGGTLPADDGAETEASVARAADSGPSRAFFQLLRGGFRAISGLIGKTDRSAYRVVTPTATIGIRGTDYEAFLCEGDCPTEGMPEDVDAGSGLVVGVNEGGIGLETPVGEFEVTPGQFAFVLENGQTYILPFKPFELMVNPTPDPEDC